LAVDIRPAVDVTVMWMIRVETALPTVLLVEDDANDALLFRRAFERSRLAARLDVVPDAESAMRYLAGEGEFTDRVAHPLPSLLLLDLKLPGMSGLDLLAWRRRQRPSIHRIPVVVLTVSFQHPDVQRAYELGVNSYLLKPVNEDAMTALVANLGLYWLVLNRDPADPEG
jgi:CheY-like chemotaxis protein